MQQVRNCTGLKVQEPCYTATFPDLGDEWAKAPAVWCDPWPGHIYYICTVVMGSKPTGGMAGLVPL